jgi:RNA polymerase sigma-70 factor (ECF subfamily)
MTSDPQLVAEAAAGSRSAGEELFERHWLAAWRLAYSLTRSPAAADDVLQDAFERAFRGLATFNGRSSFGTWLSRIVMNRAVDVARREKRLVPFDPSQLEALATDEHRAEDLDVIDAVLELPLERRTVVALRYWAGFSPPEIADVLAIPTGTVNSRLARALEELRSRLEVFDDS